MTVSIVVRQFLKRNLTARSQTATSGLLVRPADLLIIVDNKRNTALSIGAETTDLEVSRLSGFPEAHLASWARYASVRNLPEAAKSARLWAVASDTAAAPLVRQRVNGMPYLEIQNPPARKLSAAQRFSFLVESARAFRSYQATSSADAGDLIAGALAQVLCLQGRTADAVKLLTNYLGGGRSLFVEMVLYALEFRHHGKDTPDYLASLLGEDTNYFSDKWCDKPFTDFEVTPTGRSYICCPTHLPQWIGNVKQSNGEEILNSDMARRIRRSIIEGEFSYCDWSKCPQIKNRLLPSRSDIANKPEIRQWIEANDGRVAAPKFVRLSYDSTCNLWCPSCRTERIAVKGKEFDDIMRTTEQVIEPLLRNAHTAMMNGYGDIFSSRSCRRLLEVVNRQDYPHLKFLFITNGVLLTEQEWQKFPNIHDMVHSIRVSLDAATKPSYDVIRLGGDFEKLSRNLEFIARLRRDGVIGQFMISMVVQRDNFREMDAFCNWGDRLGCDMTVFEVLQNWNTFGPDGYESRAVHLPRNPLYNEYRICAQKIERRCATARALELPTQISYDFGLA